MFWKILQCGGPDLTFKVRQPLLCICHTLLAGPPGFAGELACSGQTRQFRSASNPKVPRNTILNWEGRRNGMVFLEDTSIDMDQTPGIERMSILRLGAATEFHL